MGQELTVSGSGHIVVQIEGDGNQVNLKGLAHLTLTRYLNRRQPESDADILSPYSLSIELVGRQPELQALQDWLASPKRIAVRVMTGRAGAGKTRLALQLCDQLVAEGWQAGFVTERELQRFLAMQNLSSWGWQRPCLVVVDYAAAYAQALHGWLAELSDHAGFADRPLRLLLLERSAEPGSGWWQTAFGRGDSTDKAIRRLLDPPEPVALPGLAAREDRRAVFAQAMAKGSAGLAPPAPGDDARFDDQLATLTWGGEPLFLIMAGLLAARRGVRQVLALSRTDLAFDLAERELARIARFAAGNPSRAALLTHLAAYATLVRGLAGDDLRHAIEREQAELGRADAGAAATLAEALSTALPGAKGEAAPILPDMIGEAALLLAFRSGDAAGTILRAYTAQPQQTVAAVIRTAQDFAGQKSENGPILAPLEWLNLLIEYSRPNIYQLELIAAQLMDVLHAFGTSLALTEYIRRVLEQIVAHCRKRLAADDPDAPAALAWHQNNLSIVLNQLGRHEAALAAVEESVAIRRELAAERRDAFLPRLAGSLNNLANRLSEAGRPEAALAAVTEAVELHRELAARHPNAFLPDQARTLNTLSICLSSLGRHEASLAAAEEATALCRELASARPDASMPILASSLNVLSTCLSTLGQREGALAMAEESARLRRELASARPDAFMPDLACSLNTLANRLSELDRGEAALAVAEEAVAIRRRLVAEHPEVFLSELAVSLHNLATFLGHHEQPKAALAVAEEAVAIRRDLAAERPDAFLPALALSLNNLVGCLGELDLREAALAAAEEAVIIWQGLAAKYPNAFLPRLAISLHNLANSLSKLGRLDASLEAAEEAVRMLAPAFLVLPKAFSSDMRSILRQYLQRSAALGHVPNAALLVPVAAALAQPAANNETAEMSSQLNIMLVDLR